MYTVEDPKSCIWYFGYALKSVTLVQVETCKDRIASALETLRPTTSWERTTAAGQGMDGILMGGRGFGVAMEALFNYLGSEYGSTFALGICDNIQSSSNSTFSQILFNLRVEALFKHMSTFKGHHICCLH